MQLMAAGEAEVQCGVSRPSDHSLRRRVARRRSSANRSLSGISRSEDHNQGTTNVLGTTPYLTRSAASQKLQASQISAPSEARRNQSIVCQLQRVLGGTSRSRRVARKSSSMAAPLTQERIHAHPATDSSSLKQTSAVPMSDHCRRLISQSRAAAAPGPNRGVSSSCVLAGG